MPKNAKPCYFCGGISTGREHIPPQMLFKEIECDKITVPSCDQHNTYKSGIDQKIITGFSLSLQSLQKDSRFNNITKKVPINAFNLADSKTKECVKKGVYLKPIILPFINNEIVLPEMGYLERIQDLDNWLIKMTAGLVRDGLKRYDNNINWNSAITLKPSVANFNGIKELKETQNNFGEMKKKSPWYTGWPSGRRNYPGNVFNFYLHFTNSKTIFYYIFFSVFRFYVEIEMNPLIQIELLKRINPTNSQSYIA